MQNQTGNSYYFTGRMHQQVAQTFSREVNQLNSWISSTELRPRKEDEAGTEETFWETVAGLLTWVASMIRLDILNAVRPVARQSYNTSNAH